ncbi:MAG TPA: hypothetical protein VHY37_10555 [Tepidisphaeraceae bacterium]|jgi:hypothetical protein|nr:hypothetical protein [Tepidisphaeraceae bacterium]
MASKDITVQSLAKGMEARKAQQSQMLAGEKPADVSPQRKTPEKQSALALALSLKDAMQATGLSDAVRTQVKHYQADPASFRIATAGQLPIAQRSAQLLSPQAKKSPLGVATMALAKCSADDTSPAAMTALCLFQFLND